MKLGVSATGHNRRGRAGSDMRGRIYVGEEGPRRWPCEVAPTTMGHGGVYGRRLTSIYAQRWAVGKVSTAGVLWLFQQLANHAGMWRLAGRQ
jgi:hypothetical protein